MVKYLKNILFILIMSLYISTFNMQAMAYDEEDLEWAYAKTKKLYWGDTQENDRDDDIIYKIEAIDFPRTDPYTGELTQDLFVTLNIYKDNILVSDATLYMTGDGYYEIYDGEVRVTLVSIMPPGDIHWQNDLYEPWAEVKFELRGLPDMDIEVEPEDVEGNDEDELEYKAYETSIPVVINVENEGDARLKDAELYINTDGLNVKYGKKIEYDYEVIEKDASIETIKIHLSIPSLMKDTVYNISVNVVGKDEKDNEYSFTGNEEITVLNMIRMSKHYEPEIFMTDTTIVDINIENTGSYAVNNINLKDTLPDYFEYIGSAPLEWNFNLEPGQNREFQYTLKPIQPNKDGYQEEDLPKAEAKWETGGIQYNQISFTDPDFELVVHGSKILLTKTVSPSHIELNGEATVTLTAKNVGDVRANVEIFDQSPLPDNVTLVNGERYANKVIDEEDSVSLSYKITAKTDGRYELPKATAKFFDLQGYRSEEISDSPVFTAGTVTSEDDSRPGRTPVPTPIPSPTRETPGFEMISVLIGLTLAVLLMLRRQ